MTLSRQQRCLLQVVTTRAELPTMSLPVGSNDVFSTVCADATGDSDFCPPGLDLDLPHEHRTARCHRRFAAMITQAGPTNRQTWQTHDAMMQAVAQLRVKCRIFTCSVGRTRTQPLSRSVSYYTDAHYLGIPIPTYVQHDSL